MAWNTAWKRELLEQALHARRVARYSGIEFAVAALQPGVGYQGGAAMSGPDDGDHVQIALDDDAIQVCVDEIQPGRGTPMPQQAWLHVLECEGLGEQWIVEEIDLPYAEVVRRPPPGVHVLQLRLAQEGIGGFQLSGHHGFLGLKTVRRIAAGTIPATGHSSNGLFSLQPSPRVLYGSIATTL